MFLIENKEKDSHRRFNRKKRKISGDRPQNIVILYQKNRVKLLPKLAGLNERISGLLWFRMLCKDKKVSGDFRTHRQTKTLLNR